MSQRQLRPALVVFCCLIFSTPLFSQQQAPDTSVNTVVTIDSSAIRRLPLVRSSEVASFLPRSTIRLDYEPRIRSSIGGSDLRVDDIPFSNRTFGGTRVEIPALLLQSVQLYGNGTSVSFDRPTAFAYQTAQGPTDLRGLLRVGSDAFLPGAIGTFRADAAAGGALAGVRVNAALHAQSAQSTEFNNVPGDVPMYDVAGIDTAVTYTVAPGQTRTVYLPAFEQAEDSRLPGTNWNQIVAGARLDFIASSRTNLFATGHIHRLHELAHPAAHVFNPIGQAGLRTLATAFSLAADHALQSNSMLKVRFGASSDEQTFGALSNGASSEIRGQNAGPHFGGFEFLVDDDAFPVDDALIQRVLTNSPEGASPLSPMNSFLVAGTEFRFNPYGTLDFSTRGVVTSDYEYSDEQRLFGSATLAHTLRNHGLTAGLEVNRVSTRGLKTQYIGSPSAVWKEDANVYAMFAEDIFRIGNIAIQAGVRFDAFDNPASYGETPGEVGPGAPRFTPSMDIAFSPRLAIAVPFGPAVLRFNAGKSAHAPRFLEQFGGINLDFFRYRNTNTSTLFARPLELVEQTYFGGEASFRINERFSIAASVVGVRTENDAAVARQPFEDPTNPGSSTFLSVPLNSRKLSNAGIDAMVRYASDVRNFVQLAVTHEKQEVGTTLSGVIFANPSISHTSVMALAQMAGPGLLRGVDITLAARAYGPDNIEDEALDLTFVEPNWITRLDARVSHRVSLAGIRGAVWMNALRFAGAQSFYDQVDSESRESYVAAARVIVAGGTPSDNLSLRSLDEAGFGVRNLADLVALRRAEVRFGNGDLQFTREEQENAFGAAADYRFAASTPLTQSRRIEVGVELNF